MSLATKNVATVLVGLGLVLALSFAVAAPAKADMLSDLQAQVQALLAQIASLSGSTTTTGGTAGAGCYTFTRTHQMGDTGGEVMWVQKFLNAHGAVISASGAGSPGNESDYFGAKTKAALAKWQGMNGVSPAAGYWGPLTRAKAASVCSTSVPGVPGVPGVPVTGNGLKVMLASDSPSNQSLVQGQAIGELAKFTFMNPTGSEITVTSLGFKRIGTSADSTLANIYLFNGQTRITDAAGLSNTMFNYNDTQGIFKVPAGGSVTISVRSDITTGTGGQQVGVQLLSVAASSALDTMVVLPISGGIQTISSASMGTIVFTYNGPSGATENPGTDIRVFQANAVVSTHSAWLKAITFENRGSADDNDLKNLKLYIDGEQVGSTMAQLSNGMVTFDLSANPKKLETGTRVIKVMADIVGGSSETYNIQIRKAADLNATDIELNQPVLATTMPVSGSDNTIGAASLSITRATNSPSTNVAVGATNVLWSKFEVRASGENVKIEALNVWVDQNAADDMDNVKVFLNGVQVGSTKDVATDSNPDNDGTEFTFGSSFIARQGQTEILEIYGDAKTGSGTNFAAGTSADVGVSVLAANTEGMDSGDQVSAITEIEGFSRSITASTLGISKNSGYGDQTVIAGTNNVKVGSFTLSAGSTEGVNVNTITVNLSTAEAATVTDLMLKDSSTGTQIGTTKVAPSTSNSISASFTIPASGTKTIDIYANIKSGAEAGPWIASVEGSGNGAVTASSVSFTSTALQTITVASSGTLTAGVGVSPDNALVVAGSSMVKIGSFNFTSTNTSSEVQELKVKIPNGAATSVGSVILKYKNQAGTDVTSTQALDVSSTNVHSTATFTGLTFYVPMNTTKAVDVYVDIPTVTSGAASGASITALLDGDEGFKAIDGAGNSDTTLTGSTSDLSSAGTSGKGTMVVRKTIPTLSAVALDTTTLSAGSDKVIGRVKVTADAAGDVDWGQIAFTITKSSQASGVLVGATSTIALWEGSSQVAGDFATTTGSHVSGNQMFASTNAGGTVSFRPTAIRTVSAGTSATYELRTTISSLASGSNSVDVSIANPSTSVTTGNFTTVAGTQGAGTPSFVWSDWSDVADHATDPDQAATTDWTNDYLVKTLPLTIGSKSVNI